MSGLTDLEKLARAEARIRNMINKDRESFNEFVQAATEFHKPGLTEVKQILVVNHFWGTLNSNPTISSKSS